MQYKMLMWAGIGFMAGIAMLPIFLAISTSNDAVAQQGSNTATAEQVNVLCDQTEKALRAIAKYFEPYPPDLMNCQKVANAGDG